MASAEDKELDKLIQRTQQSIERLERLQQGNRGLTIQQRVAKHVRSQGSNIVNVLMAGCVLAVAAGRLIQKNEHEVERQRWEGARRKLEDENARLRQLLDSDAAGGGGGGGSWLGSLFGRSQAADGHSGGGGGSSGGSSAAAGGGGGNNNSSSSNRGGGSSSNGVGNKGVMI